MPNPFNEEQLRSKGFTRAPDGSWFKPNPVNRDPPRRTHAEHAAGQPLAGQPPPEERNARSDRPSPEIARCIAIVTIWTCNARDYDGAGAATKGVFDRLIELGMLPIPDDGPDYLEVVFDLRQTRSRSTERMTIDVYLDPTNPTNLTSEQRTSSPIV